MEAKRVFLGLVMPIVVIGLIINYLFLPAWSIRSQGFWLMVIVLLLLASLQSMLMGENVGGKRTTTIVTITVIIIITNLVLRFAGSRLVASSKYAQMLESKITTEDFEDYSATLDNVPLLDKESAMMIANRRMGSLEDVISQFGLNDTEQITVRGEPKRVSMLNYAGIIKWMSNKDKGTPGYVKIDMSDREAQLVRVDGGINYSKKAYLGKNIRRYIRKNYRTDIFDEITLELDEEGHPYWAASIVEPTIGVFGGKDVKGLVLVDAVTGEHTRYEMAEIPKWVDNVYTSEMLLKQYDDYGKLQKGFWNAIFSQKGVRKTTEGYNYIPLGDDNWIYTGVTSVGRDESNIGFVLLNKRTKETKYYAVPGAEEFSAMSSAEGVVQHLGYEATFPLLLNVEGQPTYLVALKDSGELVKKYGMVNVEKYHLVATGAGIAETKQAYKRLLMESGADVPQAEENELEGKIEDIRQGVKEGTTYYYIKLEGRSEYYKISMMDSESIILYNVGERIKIKTSTDETSEIVPARIP